MKLVYIILLLTLFVSNNPFCQSKKLENIIQNISKIDIVEHAQIGDGSRIDFNGNIIESENYKNFKRLKEIASTQDLVKLTNHKNSTVACYASWALADTSYFDLKSIFQKFINNDRQIISYSGCIKSPDNISVELYHRYWNNVEISKRSKDKLLYELDSIILYSKNPDWLLVSRALNNRIYNKKFNKPISYLAYKKGDKEAVVYLNNWKNTQLLDSLNNKPKNINEINENNTSSVEIKYSSIQNIKQIFDNYIKYEESTDSPYNKNLMTSCLKSLTKVSNPDDFELLINVWMYYDPTDFPGRELVLDVLNKNKPECIEAVKKRMKQKKKWETDEVAPYSDLPGLLYDLNN